MSLITLQFSCPVCVVIDTDTSEIERVVVADDQLDENVQYAFYANGDTASIEDRSAAIAAYARALAQDQTWPSWEFGW